jgi:DNA-binding NtrC family response regulator
MGEAERRGETVIFGATQAPLSSDPALVSPSELERSYRRLALLYHLGRQICAETREEQVFESILDAATRLLDAERALVALLERGRLVPRGVRPLPPPPDAEPWPFSKTMVQRVLSEGVSILTDDAQRDAPSPSVLALELRSVMCVPLGNPPRGLLYVDNAARAGAFHSSDLDFLRALAQYAFVAIENARERRSLESARELSEARLELLRREIGTEREFVAESPASRALRDQIGKAACAELPVLFVGETGVGKEVFARALHAESPRAKGPFVAVHLGAVPATLVEAELFGHEKGAFTGASERRLGRLDLARGGTLFLDEILDVPLDVQPKLLRVLEERTYQRVGGREDIPLEGRIVAACNRDPQAAMREGRFRPDLYYRLAGLTLDVPPLRERVEDILPLVQHFFRHRRSSKSLDDDALACLRAHRWPGNVRELRNCVEALDVLVDGPIVRERDLPSRMRSATDAPPAADAPIDKLADAVRKLEHEHFRRALELSGGNHERARTLLGVSREKYFQRKREFGL